MSLSERLEAAEPFFRLAREVINPANGERPWHADSKDWMVVFSFAGHSLTLGDLRRAAGQDGSAERDGGDGVPVRSLSVQETDKSDRPEGVAALQQAGEPVACPREEIKQIITANVRSRLYRGHSPGRYLWSGLDAAADAILAKLSSLPQQTALVEGQSPELDEINGRLA